MKKFQYIQEQENSFVLARRFPETNAPVFAESVHFPPPPSPKLFNDCTVYTLCLYLRRIHVGRECD